MKRQPSNSFIPMGHGRTFRRGAGHRRWLSVAVIALLTVMVAPSGALASAQGAGNGEAAWSGGTIAVWGTGRVSARPDVAYLNVGAQTTAETAAEAQAAVSAWINAALEELEKLGASRRDMETVHVLVTPLWDYQGDEPELKGYRAVHDLRITVRDLNQVGAWLDALLAAGLNRVSGVYFGVEKDQDYQDEALRLAVEDARRRAQVAAAAAGVELGPVLKVEIDGSPRSPVMMERVAMAAMAADTQVMPGNIEFQANVRIIFGI